MCLYRSSWDTEPPAGWLFYGNDSETALGLFVEFIKVIQFTGMWGCLYAFQYFQCKYKVWQRIHHLIRLFVGVTYFPVVGWQQRGQFAIYKK